MNQEHLLNKKDIVEEKNFVLENMLLIIENLKKENDILKKQIEEAKYRVKRGYDPFDKTFDYQVGGRGR
jgi:hypothetical protein